VRIIESEAKRLIVIRQILERKRIQQVTGDHNPAPNGSEDCLARGPIRWQKVGV